MALAEGQRCCMHESTGARDTVAACLLTYTWFEIAARPLIDTLTKLNLQREVHLLRLSQLV